MKQNLLRTVIAALVLSFPLTLTGCPQQVSLAKFAPTIAPLAALVQKELPILLPQLVAAKAITQEKANELLAIDFQGKGKLVGDFLVSVGAINTANKQEVLDALQRAIDLFHPLTNLAPPGSVLANVLAVGMSGLNIYHAAIAIMQPPAASFSIATEGGKPAGVSTADVKATLPKLSKEAKAAMEAAGVK
jgi:hypothetical protein